MNNLSWILNLKAFDIVKWFFVVGLIMYTAFAAVIIKQVKVMSEAIEDGMNSLVVLFAWAHFLMVILLIIIAMVVL